MEVNGQRPRDLAGEAKRMRRGWGVPARPPEKHIPVTHLTHPRRWLPPRPPQHPLRYPGWVIPGSIRACLARPPEACPSRAISRIVVPDAPLGPLLQILSDGQASEWMRSRLTEEEETIKF